MSGAVTGDSTVAVRMLKEFAACEEAGRGDSPGVQAAFGSP